MSFVNKLFFVRLGLYFCLSFFILTPATAQKLSKYYVSSKTGSATLYFIKPQSGFMAKANQLVYDLTYLDTCDYITLNFTLFSKTDLSIDSISVLYKTQSITAETTKLFVEFDNVWQYRCTSVFPYASIREIYADSQPPELLISSRSSNLRLQIKQSKWDKLQQATDKIFKIIDANKPN